jgi:hypothetical protein
LQAGKLFDRKNGGKPLDPEAKAMKIQCTAFIVQGNEHHGADYWYLSPALNSAANSVLR